MVCAPGGSCDKSQCKKIALARVRRVVCCNCKKNKKKNRTDRILELACSLSTRGAFSRAELQGSSAVNRHPVNGDGFKRGGAEEKYSF